MLIVSIEEAAEGMSLAAPVANPEQPGQYLLKRGYILEQAVIKRLLDLGIGQIFVDYPGLDDLDRHLMANLSPARQVMYNQIKKGIAQSQKNAHAAISYNDYYETTRDLITTLLQQGPHPVFMDQVSRMGGDAVGHATSVAHLSLLLGIKLESYLIAERKRLPPAKAREVVNIGVAGMLHDIGKTTLPQALQAYTVADPPEDETHRKQWETHTRIGYEMVHDRIEPSAASAVMHHHQRFDGNGFPSRKQHDGGEVHQAGKSIHIFSRIIAAADLYDRLCAPPKPRPPRDNLQVLHLLRTQYAGWLDPHILKTLQSICPPYPPGTKVVLSDGTRAIVTGIDPTDPYKPMVKQLVGGNVVGDSVALNSPGAPGIKIAAGQAVGPYLPVAS